MIKFTRNFLKILEIRPSNFFHPPLKLRYENGTSPTRATCHNLIRINHPLKMHFNHETACDTCNKYTSIRVHVSKISLEREREILT